MKRVLRLLGSLVVLLTVMIAVFLGSGELTQRAFGYNNYPVAPPYPCPFPYSGSGIAYIPYKNHGSNPPYNEYQLAYDLGRNNWDTSPTPVFFQLNPDGRHTLAVRASGARFPPGNTIVTCPGGVRTATDVELNSDRLDLWSQQAKQSTAAHELGHLVGLIESSYKPAVMNPNDDPNTVYQLKHDDLCGARAMYINPAYPNTCWRASENINSALNGSLYLCMDVSGYSFEDWANVITWDCNAQLNQRLDRVNTEFEWFTLRFQHTGKCLDVAWGGLSNGDDIIQYDCAGTPWSMQWRRIEIEVPGPTSEPPRIFQNRNSGLCVDVEGQSLDRGAIVHQWGIAPWNCGGWNSQKWNRW